MRVGPVTFGNHRPLAVIAGPCVIESRDSALATATVLRDMTARLGLPLVYKSSFDKANRTSLAGFRGPGIEEGLAILAQVRREIGVPVVTDVHEIAQAAPAAAVVDLLQTPAFLCRQTDFIQAVAATGKPVNLKKGQFLAPEAMVRVADKAAATGNRDLLLCERGYAFGYGNLVVDMRGLEIMARTGYPVVFDATHSVQLPGGLGGSSGGERRFVPVLARAAVAAGVAAVFLETHPDPDHAPCAGPNMIPFDRLEGLLRDLKRLDEVVKVH
ncbi:MAG: 3-deoxy-8-phosphooctulonate synthase [Magnetococcales bacterium]|nr:3-deoxy-8-phosphooctulonate synthase [Magnetococcales bacterium]